MGAGAGVAGAPPPPVKAEKRNVGWLFPLEGGPHHGVEVRLPWPRLIGPANKKVPADGAMYDQLPDEIRFPSGAVYTKQLKTYASGKSKGELRTLKNGKPMFRYVYATPLHELEDITQEMDSARGSARHG